MPISITGISLAHFFRMCLSAANGCSHTYNNTDPCSGFLLRIYFYFLIIHTIHGSIVVCQSSHSGTFQVNLNDWKWRTSATLGCDIFLVQGIVAYQLISIIDAIRGIYISSLHPDKFGKLLANIDEISKSARETQTLCGSVVNDFIIES